MVGRELRGLLHGLVAMPNVRGGLFVAPDGLVIAAELPAEIPVEALSALVATLGRELEVGGARTVRGRFDVARFGSADGSVFLGATPIGFVILLATAAVDDTTVTHALRNAVATVRKAWARATG